MLHQEVQSHNEDHQAYTIDTYKEEEEKESVEKEKEDCVVQEIQVPHLIRKAT